MARTRIGRALRALAWVGASLLWLVTGGLALLAAPLPGLAALGFAVVVRLLWTHGSVREAISPWLLVLGAVFGLMAFPAAT